MAPHRDPADALRAAGGAGAALAAHAADRAVPLRLARRAKNPAGHPQRRPHPSRHRPAAAAEIPLRLRIFRLLGRTIPGWSRSMRSTPPSAAPTIRTRTRVTRAEREDVWKLILNAQGRREAVTARVLVNAAGPWVGIVSETVLRIGGPSAGAARQGQPYRGAQAVRPRPRLHFPEHRQAHRVRPAVRGRFHADRHDRREFRRLARRRGAERRRGDLSLPRGERVLPRARSSPDQVVWAFAGVRSLYDDERGPGHARGRHARLPSRCSTSVTAWRRCSRSTAARSRPIAGWRRTRSASSRISSSCTGAGPRQTPLPGGDFLWDAIEARVAQTLRAWPFLDEAEAWRLVRAYGTRVERVLGERQAARGHRAVLRSAQRGRGALPDGSTNGRGSPTTCCGGGASSG